MKRKSNDVSWKLHPQKTRHLPGRTLRRYEQRTSWPTLHSWATEAWCQNAQETPTELTDWACKSNDFFLRSVSCSGDQISNTFHNAGFRRSVSLVRSWEKAKTEKMCCRGALSKMSAARNLCKDRSQPCSFSFRVLKAMFWWRPDCRKARMQGTE